MSTVAPSIFDLSNHSHTSPVPIPILKTIHEQQAGLERTQVPRADDRAHAGAVLTDALSSLA